MPVINKIQRKPKSKSQTTPTEIRKLRQEFYQSKLWKATRLAHLKEFPLCDECLKKGKVTAGEHVHHKRSPFKDGKINWTLGLDDDNLETICATCHGLEHAKEKGYVPPEKIIEELDNLLK